MGWARPFEDPERRSHRPFGIVFVREGIAEVDEEPIAKILGDVTVEPGDHFATCLLIRPHNVPELFRIEPARERGRVHEIAEEDRQLPPLGIGGLWAGSNWCAGHVERRAAHWPR